MNTNCPNCGAVIDTDNHKCSYCGTSYFDLSAINIDDRKPMFVKIKCNGYILTMYAIPTVDSIETTCDSTNITDSTGNIIMQYSTSKTIQTNLVFKALNMPNKDTYMIVEAEGNKQI